MNRDKLASMIAKELGLEYTEKECKIMLKMLDGGISPDNLSKILQEIQKETKIRKYHK